MHGGNASALSETRCALQRLEQPHQCDFQKGYGRTVQPPRAALPRHRGIYEAQRRLPCRLERTRPGYGRRIPRHTPGDTPPGTGLHSLRFHREKDQSGLRGLRGPRARERGMCECPCRKPRSQVRLGGFPCGDILGQFPAMGEGKLQQGNTLSQRRRHQRRNQLCRREMRTQEGLGRTLEYQRMAR